MLDGLLTNHNSQFTCEVINFNSNNEMHSCTFQPIPHIPTVITDQPALERQMSNEYIRFYLVFVLHE